MRTAGLPDGTFEGGAATVLAVSDGRIRNLIIILGDQLNRDSGVFDGFDPSIDRIWMAEVPAEATVVWSHKARIAAFLSAMRHFRDQLQSEGFPVVYHQLGTHRHTGLTEALCSDISALKPCSLVMAPAGDFRVQAALREIAANHRIPVEVRPDRHFLLTESEFTAWSHDKSTLRCEFLYRMLRRRTGVLMKEGQPEGGKWNYDAENRKGFGRQGPPRVPPHQGFPPDALSRQVMQDVQGHFSDHPGSLEDFDWPMTSRQARTQLLTFVQNRLPLFGRWQDALWTNEPVLFHSRLSFALNVKLISPAEAIEAALEAWRDGRAPLPAVEGFIRQLMGWREFVKGIYWTRMPGYLEHNALAAELPLPTFYWTAETEMNCLREVLGQTLRTGYAHHIQRLMVTGLFALLLGVEPQQVHQWYLAVYVDAVEWVEAPNTLGMSQYADGGLVASKPYVASGHYIARMSNYCQSCRFKPELILGPTACPFTTLYWDFLRRHRDRFARHPRTALQWQNLSRFDDDTNAAIQTQATQIRASMT